MIDIKKELFNFEGHDDKFETCSVPAPDPSNRMSILCDFQGKGYPGGGYIGPFWSPDTIPGKGPFVNPKSPYTPKPGRPKRGPKGPKGIPPGPTRVGNPNTPGPWQDPNGPFHRGPQVWRRALPKVLFGVARNVNPWLRLGNTLLDIYDLMQTPQVGSIVLEHPGWELYVGPCNPENLGAGSLFTPSAPNACTAASQYPAGPWQGTFEGAVMQNWPNTIRVGFYSPRSLGRGQFHYGWQRLNNGLELQRPFPMEFAPGRALTLLPEAADPVPLPWALIPYNPNAGYSLAPAPRRNPRTRWPRKPPIGTREKKRKPPVNGGLDFLRDLRDLALDYGTEFNDFIECFDGV